MNLFCFIRDCFSRIFERKILLIILSLCFVAFAILGMVFIDTPAIYDYHLTLCDRFIDRVCYSDRSVFVIFLERTAGHFFLLAVVLSSGVHVVALIVPMFVCAYRAYVFGGSLYIFFTVYRVSGAFIVFACYLPIHLLVDAVLLFAVCFSCSRTRRFCFGKEGLCDILKDLLVLGIAIVLIGLLEMILILALFPSSGMIL